MPNKLNSIQNHGDLVQRSNISLSHKFRHTPNWLGHCACGTLTPLFALALRETEQFFVFEEFRHSIQYWFTTINRCTRLRINLVFLLLNGFIFSMRVSRVFPNEKRIELCARVYFYWMSLKKGEMNKQICLGIRLK